MQSKGRVTQSSQPWSRVSILKFTALRNQMSVWHNRHCWCWACCSGNIRIDDISMLIAFEPKETEALDKARPLQNSDPREGPHHHWNCEILASAILPLLSIWWWHSNGRGGLVLSHSWRDCCHPRCPGQQWHHCNWLLLRRRWQRHPVCLKVRPFFSKWKGIWICRKHCFNYEIYPCLIFGESGDVTWLP